MQPPSFEENTTSRQPRKFGADRYRASLEQLQGTNREMLSWWQKAKLDERIAETRFLLAEAEFDELYSRILAEGRYNSNASAQELGLALRKKRELRKDYERKKDSWGIDIGMFNHWWSKPKKNQEEGSSTEKSALLAPQSSPSSSQQSSIPPAPNSQCATRRHTSTQPSHD